MRTVDPNKNAYPITSDIRGGGGGFDIMSWLPGGSHDPAQMLPGAGGVNISSLPVQISSQVTRRLPFELPGFAEITSLFFPQAPTQPRYQTSGIDPAAAPKTDATQYFTQVFSTPQPAPGSNPNGVNTTASPTATPATPRQPRTYNVKLNAGGPSWISKLVRGDVTRLIFGDNPKIPLPGRGGLPKVPLPSPAPGLPLPGNLPKPEGSFFV